MLRRLDSDAELVERPKTPGQRAYDEYSSGGAMPSWDDLGPGMQRKWNDVAEAARSCKIDWKDYE